MGMFSSLLKGTARDAVNKVSGTKDFLEGSAAIVVLAAAAEGGIDEGEKDTAFNVLTSNKVLSTSFSAAEIESEFNRCVPKAATRSGKAELMTEIREVIARDKDGTLGKAMMYMALDVADHGEISAAETMVLKNLAGVCKVDYNKLIAGTA